MRPRSQRGRMRMYPCLELMQPRFIQRYERRAGFCRKIKTKNNLTAGAGGLFFNFQYSFQPWLRGVHIYLKASNKRVEKIGKMAQLFSGVTSCNLYITSTTWLCHRYLALTENFLLFKRKIVSGLWEYITEFLYYLNDFNLQIASCQIL